MKETKFQNRGIKAQALVDLVKNTAPFLFTSETDALVSKKQYRYIKVLRDAVASPAGIDSNLIAYFELAICSHFATVGTFVPTDVDLAIRQKLWKFVDHEEDFETMWKLVEEFLTWDESPVSHRVILGAGKGKLSGHQGEWYSIAVGAYGTAHRCVPHFLGEVREAIEAEVKFEEETLAALFLSFEKDPTPVTMKPLLAGIAAVAHNLGDLDRMIEAWEIEESDILKRRVFRVGHEDARTPREVFTKAGVIYQAMLANENHRHFALREPKPLRRSGKFLLNYGPFLDEWGKNLVKEGVNTGIFTEGDFRDIVEALISGWKRLNGVSIYFSQGYARALTGIMSALPRGRSDLEGLLPPALQKEISTGGLRTLMGVTQTQFETQWMRKLQATLRS